MNSSFRWWSRLTIFRLRQRLAGNWVFREQRLISSQRLEANPQVLFDRGKSALRRGPLIYRLEQADQEAPVAQIVLPLGAKPEDQYMPELPGSVTVMKGHGLLRAPEEWNDMLYDSVGQAKGNPLTVTAVPYCVWSNRRLGKMAVWIDATR